MKTILIDAFARAFGMSVFVVVSLWIGHKGFPGNWSALVVLYLLCIPLAALYGWLAGPQLEQDIAPSRRRLPGLLLIGIAVAGVAVGYAACKTKVDSFFYGAREMTSNNTLNTDRQQAS